MGSGITASGSGITSHVIGMFLMDQRSDCTMYHFLWDKGQKVVTLLEPRIGNENGNGSAYANAICLKTS